MLDPSLRLFLFVPADRPQRFAKAINSGADAIIIDLEDAVAPDAKETSLDGLAYALRQCPSPFPIFLRINPVGTRWHGREVRAARDLPLAGVMLPKSETAHDVEAVAGLSNRPVIALLETARGIAEVASVAASASRLAFGSIDYALDLSIAHSRMALLGARTRLVEASRLARLSPPIDGVTTTLDDEAALRDDCAHAVELGFDGKLLIHPRQLEAARAGFRPSDAEIVWARRVVERAAAADTAAFRLGGQMIDAPVIARARNLLERIG